VPGACIELALTLLCYKKKEELEGFPHTEIWGRLRRKYILLVYLHIKKMLIQLELLLSRVFHLLLELE